MLEEDDIRAVVVKPAPAFELDSDVGDDRASLGCDIADKDTPRFALGCEGGFAALA